VVVVVVMIMVVMVVVIMLMIMMVVKGEYMATDVSMKISRGSVPDDLSRLNC
jgi:hypothetical protein